MALPHEEAAREEHPGAHSFVAVIEGDKLIGWTFSVPGSATQLGMIGWMTSKLEVASDKATGWEGAEHSLKTFVKYMKEWDAS